MPVLEARIFYNKNAEKFPNRTCNIDLIVSQKKNLIMLVEGPKQTSKAKMNKDRKIKNKHDCQQ